MASRTAHRWTVRHTIASAVLFAVVATMPWAFASRAEAALTDVAVDPTSGPVGTAVTVSGSACPPGILINPSRAGVLIVTLGVSIDVVVPASGEWSVPFVVPSGALQGAHAIVVTCTRDLLPLPYLPLTFTVTAPEPPPPSTTIEPAGAPTTTVSTTLPTTTIASAPTGSTTTAPTAVTSSDAPRQSDGEMPEASPTEAPTTTPATTRWASDEPSPSTSHAVSVAASEEVVSAARTERGERRRPLAFGALSPLGRGWMGVLISILLAAAFAILIVAILWFRWLRHTQAREWWIRWFHQILRIRAHASPPP